MRRFGLAVVLVLACSGLVLSPVASAPASLEVTDSGVVAEFPTSLQFTVSAESPHPVTDARLLYTIDKMNHAPVVSEAWAVFEPATSVSTSWTWDMRRASLPPGAEITYWWRVTDKSGETVETTPAVLNFDDDRYGWQRIESDDVTLHWYYGGDEFAHLLLDICNEAIEMLAEDVGTRLDRRIQVYVYRSPEDLRGAMIYPQEWTGGVAFVDYSIVAIGIGPGDLGWGVRALRHELTHLVVHTTTFSPYGVLPRWLDEGLATHMEAEQPSHTFTAILVHAVEQDELISLRTLNGPFSSDTTKAYLSYAQSLSVVRYLLDAYGTDPMYRLLMLLEEGETIDSALQQSYGKDLDDIEAEWRTVLRKQVLND